ncbi:MAG: nucleotidyltransferase family protein [Candidatus Zambryskibacteria bacterium]|nr:nucleotidyltransferase family protein [Candidatus Zambryskibacteria bacterium]
MEKSINTIKSIITPYLKQYPISYAGIFGSYARGDFRAESDIDILIRYSQPMDLFQYGGLLNKLELATGKKIDLVIESTLHPLMMKYIKKDLVNIYE